MRVFGLWVRLSRIAEPTPVGLLIGYAMARGSSASDQVTCRSSLWSLTLNGSNLNDHYEEVGSSKRRVATLPAAANRWESPQIFSGRPSSCVMFTRTSLAMDRPIPRGQAH